MINMLETLVKTVYRVEKLTHQQNYDVCLF